jgi:hypothetical protein
MKVQLTHAAAAASAKETAESAQGLIDLAVTNAIVDWIGQA